MTIPTFNIYCDESCHLEFDQIPVMVLGAVWCPVEKASAFFRSIRDLKIKHGFSKNFEIKWTKVSSAKIGFYLEVIEYFFSEEDLNFRGVVIPDKGKLKHELFHQDHDEFYYKMWFVLLKQIFELRSRYRIYLDIKDTRGYKKVNQLHRVLCNARYDFNRDLIERVQQVRSHEVEILQLTDFLTGALAYVHRGLNTSDAKLKLIDKIRELSQLSLLRTTLPKAKKVNLLVWNAQEW